MVQDKQVNSEQQKPQFRLIQVKIELGEQMFASYKIAM